MSETNWKTLDLGKDTLLVIVFEEDVDPLMWGKVCDDTCKQVEDVLPDQPFMIVHNNVDVYSMDKEMLLKMREMINGVLEEMGEDE